MLVLNKSCSKLFFHRFSFVAVRSPSNFKRLSNRIEHNPTYFLIIYYFDVTITTMFYYGDEIKQRFKRNTQEFGLLTGF